MVDLIVIYDDNPNQHKNPSTVDYHTAEGFCLLFVI